MVRIKSRITYRLFSAVLSVILLVSFTVPAGAQNVFAPPASGVPAVSVAAFHPAVIKGLTIHPENPFLFDFIVHPGDDYLQGQDLKTESQKLVKYFLAALTVPEDRMWVNLNPQEPDRIIPEGLGRTVMGRDLLEQDYLLKQLTASLMSPDSKTGAELWNKIYEKAYQQYGITDVPTDILNKVWIVPDSAVIYQSANNVFVVESKLKVLLEEEYFQASEKKNPKPYSLSCALIKEIIIPVIQREVNYGKTFANLRQISNAVILATWYKHNVRGSILKQDYINQNKTEGVKGVGQTPQEIYDNYLQAFQNGVRELIREEYDPNTKEIVPKKYITGGAVQQWSGEDIRMTRDKALLAKDLKGTSRVTVRLGDENSDAAMTASADDSPEFNDPIGEMYHIVKKITESLNEKLAGNFQYRFTQSDGGTMQIFYQKKGKEKNFLVASLPGNGRIIFILDQEYQGSILDAMRVFVEQQLGNYFYKVHPEYRHVILVLSNVVFNDYESPRYYLLEQALEGDRQAQQDYREILTENIDDISDKEILLFIENMKHPFIQDFWMNEVGADRRYKKIQKRFHKLQAILKKGEKNILEDNFRVDVPKDADEIREIIAEALPRVKYLAGKGDFLSASVLLKQISRLYAENLGNRQIGINFLEKSINMHLKDHFFVLTKNELEEKLKMYQALSGRERRILYADEIVQAFIFGFLLKDPETFVMRNIVNERQMYFTENIVFLIDVLVQLKNFLDGESILNQFNTSHLSESHHPADSVPLGRYIEQLVEELKSRGISDADKLAVFPQDAVDKVTFLIFKAFLYNPKRKEDNEFLFNLCVRYLEQPSGEDVFHIIISAWNAVERLKKDHGEDVSAKEKRIQELTDQIIYKKFAEKDNRDGDQAMTSEEAGAQKEFYKFAAKYNKPAYYPNGKFDLESFLTLARIFPELEEIIISGRLVPEENGELTAEGATQDVSKPEDLLEYALNVVKVHYPMITGSIINETEKEFEIYLDMDEPYNYAQGHRVIKLHYISKEIDRIKQKFDVVYVQHTESEGEFFEINRDFWRPVKEQSKIGGKILVSDFDGEVRPGKGIFSYATAVPQRRGYSDESRLFVYENTITDKDLTAAKYENMKFDGAFHEMYILIRKIIKALNQKEPGKFYCRFTGPSSMKIMTRSGNADRTPFLQVNFSNGNQLDFDLEVKEYLSEIEDLIKKHVKNYSYRANPVSRRQFNLTLHDFIGNSENSGFGLNLLKRALEKDAEAIAEYKEYLFDHSQEIKDQEIILFLENKEHPFIKHLWENEIRVNDRYKALRERFLEVEEILQKAESEDKEEEPRVGSTLQKSIPDMLIELNMREKKQRGEKRFLAAADTLEFISRYYGERLGEQGRQADFLQKAINMRFRKLFLGSENKGLEEDVKEYNALTKNGMEIVTAADVIKELKDLFVPERTNFSGLNTIIGKKNKYFSENIVQLIDMLVQFKNILNGKIVLHRYTFDGVVSGNRKDAVLNNLERYIEQLKDELRSRAEGGMKRLDEVLRQEINRGTLYLCKQLSLKNSRQDALLLSDLYARYLEQADTRAVFDVILNAQDQLDILQTKHEENTYDKEQRLGAIVERIMNMNPGQEDSAMISEKDLEGWYKGEEFGLSDKRIADPALISNKREAPGGIDLNPARMKMRIQGEPIYMQTSAEVPYLDGNNLMPIIINISPVMDIPALLGS